MTKMKFEDLNSLTKSTFQPAMEFGPAHTLSTLTALYDNLSDLDACKEVIPELTSAELMAAIDHFAPEQNGQRKLGNDLNFHKADVAMDPDPYHIAIAGLQMHIWFRPSDHKTLEILNEDLWHSIQFLEMKAKYEVDISEDLMFDHDLFSPDRISESSDEIAPGV